MFSSFKAGRQLWKLLLFQVNITAEGFQRDVSATAVNTSTDFFLTDLS
jgi:hypothetical protein